MIDIHKIRQISDPILHRRPQLVDFEVVGSDRLVEMVALMMEQLQATGGIGIAANQCAELEEPLQIVIVGLEDPAGRERASLRYPDQEIPYPFVMINPEIREHRGGTYCPGEGCLSVMGPLRGKVKRFKEVTVKYFDIDGNEHVETYTGLIAHIVQHEVAHLEGEVFLETILEALNKDQRITLKRHLNHELSRRKSQDNKEHFELTPMLVFDRNNAGKLVIDEQQLTDSLSKMPNKALLGLQKFLKA